MKVGAVMPIAEGELSGHTASYPELREIAQTAEDAGLDSIWVYDHLLFRSPGEPTTGIHECWSMLAALAADTSRVEVGTIVLAIPFRNPAILAKMAATVDEISGGRLILGLGAGWNEPEFDAFGIPFDHGLVGSRRRSTSSCHCSARGEPTSTGATTRPMTPSSSRAGRERRVRPS